jgi:pyruvate dehydrogenase E1 component alpha subunit
VQLLDPQGLRRSLPIDRWIADVDDELVVSLYEDLVICRRIDTEATALQRQGELALWAPMHGQEAAQLGSARALRGDDFIFSSYREHAVAYARGVALGDLLKLWRGSSAGGWDPFSVNMAIPAIIIGAQALHATGYAMGLKNEGSDAAAITYFGDGATSQGDIAEAMVFAASYKVPVVFFCQNNHWAISEPVTLQSRTPIADRAPGYGIPSVRVDGNDVLAVMAVTREALERARRGEGPTFIEAVTYRMGPHTTSDDPSRYADPLEREDWAAKDPIVRVEAYLRSTGALTDEIAGQVSARADEVARRLRAAVLAMPDPAPLSMFDHAYAEPHRGLQRQRSQYAAYLEGMES